jgi:hypothetical protein
MFINKSVHKITVENIHRKGTSFSFYPAAALDPRYSLNKHYVKVQRQSWRDTKNTVKKKKIDITFDIEKGNSFHINYNTIYSLIYLYSDIPAIHDPNYSNNVFLYKYARILDYITFLNKQPNEINLIILLKTFKSLGIDLVKKKISQKCLQELTTLPCLPEINKTANFIRCSVSDINPDTFFNEGTFGGGENENIQDKIINKADELNILPEQLRDDEGPEPGPFKILFKGPLKSSRGSKSSTASKGSKSSRSLKSSRASKSSKSSRSRYINTDTFVDEPTEETFGGW